MVNPTGPIVFEGKLMPGLTARSRVSRVALVVPVAAAALVTSAPLADAGIGPAATACIGSYTATVTAHDGSTWKTTATDVYTESTASCARAFAATKPYVRAFCPRCAPVTSADGYRYVAKRGGKGVTARGHGIAVQFRVSSKRA